MKRLPCAKLSQARPIAAWAVLIALSLVSLLAARGVQAQLCKADSECELGQACVLYPNDDGCCAPDCQGPHCASACAMTDPTIARCLQKECDSDEQCPEHMVCWQHTESFCQEPNCCDGDDACRARGTRCSEQSFHECAPRFLPPCSKAADCGDGFDCVDDNRSVCGACAPGARPMGGSGAAAGTGGGGGSDAACCELQAIKTCKLRRMPCESDAECPAPLACDVNYAHYQCPPTGGSGSPEPDLAKCPTNASEPAKLCGLSGYAGIPPQLGPDAPDDGTGGSGGAGGSTMQAGRSGAGGRAGGAGRSAGDGGATQGNAATQERGGDCSAAPQPRHGHVAATLGIALLAAFALRRRRVLASGQRLACRDRTFPHPPSPAWRTRPPRSPPMWR